MNISLAETGRLVDIPVPPNSAGYADFTEEEAAEKAEEYEDSKNNITAESLVGKSGNYYLKSLNIDGYNLNPEFNRQNSNYTIYTKDDSINTFYVTAEPDNENAKVEGLGKVTISEEQRLINVTVTAENGNVKVYTINVENETNKQKKSTANGSIKWIIIITIMVIIICIGAIIIKKNHKDS
jgi:hypothetical protein